MAKDLVITKLDAASRMLAEAKTIQETKRIIDVAAAAEVYARRQKLGAEAVEYATAIKVEALRQLGTMLKDAPKATGTKGQLIGRGIIGGTKLEPPITTYADLGLDKKTAALAQQIADLPTQQFEAVKRGAVSIAEARKSVKAANREAMREQLAESGKSKDKQTNLYALVCADIDGGLPDIESNSVDVIITDPPYSLEFLPLYESLARVAARTLKPGGLAVVMCGQSYLPVILPLMAAYLTWHWMAAYLTPGGQSAQQFQRKVNTFWKPLLIFSKGNYDGGWFGDVCKSDPNDNDKYFHEWGQSVSGMMDIIGRFSKPGDLILDPFCGAGTTGVACLRLGRRFAGVDRDQNQINISAKRLAELQND